MGQDLISSRDIIKRLMDATNSKTETGLAELLGITKSSISNWEKRNTIDLHLIFSKIKDLDYDFIINGKIGNNNKEDLKELYSCEEISEIVKLSSRSVRNKLKNTIPADIISTGGRPKSLYPKNILELFRKNTSSQKDDILIDKKESAIGQNFTEQKLMEIIALKDSEIKHWQLLAMEYEKLANKYKEKVLWLEDFIKEKMAKQKRGAKPKTKGGSLFQKLSKGIGKRKN